MSDSASPRAAGSRRLRVVVVTGIFPPDVGGPATHAADLADELRDRGNAVTVLTVTDAAADARRQGDVLRYPRRWPWWFRDAAVARWLVRNRARYDVIYATGMHEAAVAGARAARRPVMVKIVGDPAWERGSRLGLTRAGFESFQTDTRSGLRVRLMCEVRNWSVANASSVIVPGAELKTVVEGWMGDVTPGEVRLVPNGVRIKNQRSRSRARSGDLHAVYVGRLIAHKRIEVLIDAVAKTPGVRLDVIGDGPGRAALETYARSRTGGDTIHFAGAIEHEEVLARLGGFDLLLNASSYEGLPHVAIEALVCGTPLAISPVGGTADVLADGRNGVLVDPPTPDGFAATLTRLRDDRDELARLAEGARRDGERWRFERVADVIEGLLRELVDETAKPAAVFVGKGGIPTSTSPAWHRKLDVFARHLDTTIVSPAPPGPRRERGVSLRRFRTFRPRPLASAGYYLGGSLLGTAVAARKRGALVCQSPYEAASCLAIRTLVPRRARSPIMLEVHGDWRTASRLYGSGARRVVAPIADRVAAWAVRNSDRLRVIGTYTEGLARDAGFRGSMDRYVAFSDWRRFLEPEPVALPEAPHAVFIGVLEPYKAPDVLLDAWARVARDLPAARLSLVGSGPMRPRLERRAIELGIDDSVEFRGTVAPGAVIDVLDGASCLTLPSRSEGLGRVVLEAMARARPIVASRVGGIPELVEDGTDGFLVPPGDAELLADALSKTLEDRELAGRMGDAARRRVAALDPDADFDAGIARVATWIAQSRR